MNSFGQKQLLKYGWTIGKGLGAEEDGMTDAIKPKLKFCTTGLGHNIAEEFTFHWWDHVYNKAAQNLNVKKKQNGHIEIEKQKGLTISTKKPSKFRVQNGKGLYDYFVKGNILNGPKETNENNDSDSDTDSENEDRKDYSSNLTDEQLFQICGGLTAHKGARHGLTMSAKLARLEQQEKYNQIKPFQCSPVLTNLPLKLVFAENQDTSLQLEPPPWSPKVQPKLKPILKESTPDNSNFKKRKSVQFNEDLKLKIFSYCAPNCEKESDISIKMEDDETPSSTLAVYVEEFSIENNINSNGGIKIKKKKKKFKKNLIQNDEDIWELLKGSLQQKSTKLNGKLEDPKTSSLTLDANKLNSFEQKENNENFEQTKKMKKKRLNNNEEICMVGSKILQSSESEVLGLTKKQKKQKKQKNDLCYEIEAELGELSDNSCSQTNLLSELKKNRKKGKKIKKSCSNGNLLEQMQETIDISLSSHITILDDSVCSEDNFERNKKRQTVIESAIEQVTMEEVCTSGNKKKKSKRKLEDVDVATSQEIDIQSFSPKKKKKKYLDEGSSYLAY